jgi:hypothetical protein
MNEVKKNSGWRQKAARELIEYWINFVYLACFFGAFTWCRRFILAEYQISYSHYGIALIEALVLAKVILIGDFLHLGRGLENKPLILPTLYKTLVFTLLVGLFGLLEHTVSGLVHGRGLAGGLEELRSGGKYELPAKCLVIFFSFIPFFSFKELGRVLGEGRIRALFFRRKSSAGSDLLSGSGSEQAAH